jgi:hypothetical protein
MRAEQQCGERGCSAFLFALQTRTRGFRKQALALGRTETDQWGRCNYIALLVGVNIIYILWFYLSLSILLIKYFRVNVTNEFQSGVL